LVWLLLRLFLGLIVDESTRFRTPPAEDPGKRE
jgi:hypothetical protein